MKITVDTKKSRAYIYREDGAVVADYHRQARSGTRLRARTFTEIVRQLKESDLATFGEFKPDFVVLDLSDARVRLSVVNDEKPIVWLLSYANSDIFITFGFSATVADALLRALPTTKLPGDVVTALENALS